MNHKTSNTPINYSTEYKKFKLIAGNRNLNELKIKRIIQDIDNGLNMLKFCPIVVTKDLAIIDGQHRFQVSKILKLPVYYVIADDLTLHQIASINSRTERWKPNDFVNCYASVGNKDYILLRDFINEFNLPVSAALNVLTCGLSSMQRSPKIKLEFEEGNFKVQQAKDARRIVEYAIRFDKFSGNRSGSFLEAISHIMKINKFDPEVLIEKYTANPDALFTQSGRKEYLMKLEEIYNYRNQKRYAIY